MLLASTLLFVVLAARDVVLPRTTLACSCAPQLPLGMYAMEPSTVIVLGTIGPVVDQKAVLQIERLFRGELSDPVLRLDGGDGAMCGVTLVAGARVLMYAVIDAGVARPGSCTPYGDLSTAEGQRLLAEAVNTFGDVEVPGTGPPTAPATGPPTAASTDPPVAPTNPPAAPTGQGLDPGVALLLVVALVIGGAIALFGVVAILARRRPPA